MGRAVTMSLEITVKHLLETIKYFFHAFLSFVIDALVLSILGRYVAL